MRRVTTNITLGQILFILLTLITFSGISFYLGVQHASKQRQEVQVAYGQNGLLPNEALENEIRTFLEQTPVEFTYQNDLQTMQAMPISQASDAYEKQLKKMMEDRDDLAKAEKERDERLAKELAERDSASEEKKNENTDGKLNQENVAVSEQKSKKSTNEDNTSKSVFSVLDKPVVARHAEATSSQAKAEAQDVYLNVTAPSTTERTVNDVSSKNILSTKPKVAKPVATHSTPPTQSNTYNNSVGMTNRAPQTAVVSDMYRAPQTSYDKPLTPQTSVTQSSSQPNSRLNSSSVTPVASENVAQQVKKAVRYRVLVGSFSNRSRADEALTMWKARGYSPRLVESEIAGKGKWYRLELGSFNDQNQAGGLQKAIMSRFQESARVISSE